jgi:hypothetical protein
MKAMTSRQRWNLSLVIAACVAYLALTVTAPRSNEPNTYHFSVALILILTLTIIGLLLLTWVLGFYAWLQLDRYANKLPAGSSRQAFGQMARGTWLLAIGLIVSSLLGATKPFYNGNAGIDTIMTQLNYCIIVVFPFLGFMWLRIGSRHLAVAAQAVMTVQAKLLTVGPPVALLASFYVFLAITNSTPGAQMLASGPVGFLVLPVSIILVVASWVLGLLAALNIERATYRGEGARNSQPLVKLYNGILTTTGGFIILDALLSLGNDRLQALPVGVILLLVYAFIGVVGLGFLVVALSARELVMMPTPRAKE